MEDNLNSSSVNKQISKIDKEINILEGKKNKLVDMRLEDSIGKAIYEAKYADLVVTQETLIEDRKKLAEISENEKVIKLRLKEFKKTLEQNEVLDEFDRYVFESVVEKVIIGGIDEDGNKDPAQITFVYKTGFKSNINGDRFRPQRKNAKGRHRTDELCSYDNNEVERLIGFGF
ncbi:recombinase [Clostridium botulinum]|uniref:recombinase n=1 Tax=Clostridium botulinum TaxID=1491 RepID=UPI000E093B93|nr:recombinase [Clostridium botulinum]AXG93540.1 recombinase [Clostridium botulinum]